jgi:2-polyprenyl-6-methoxyphenol hydroxylase-like FAD-dependent oxidoreductase
MTRTTQHKVGQHAIVIGGSMGGLLTARALADHFERVTVLERDAFPEGPQPRKGVPQGRHSHALLAAGFRIIEGYFPGIKDDLVRDGALYGDIIDDSTWYQFGGYKARFQSGLFGLLMSRPLLEWHVGRRVRGLGNVSVLDRCGVQGLRAHDGRVNAVLLERNGIQETMQADLIVDASGRGSRAPTWLEALGYARPEESQVKVNVGYVTRQYRRAPGRPRTTATLCIPQAPHQKRFGVALAIEDDRWTVSVGGWLGDHAPTDEAGLLEFARNLPMPEIYEIIRDAEPLTEIEPYKYHSSQRRHFERLRRFPEGFLVTGDAMASFNPTYGQGMTVAALEAQALAACLTERGTLEGLWRRFFKRASIVVDIPWTIAVGEDLRFPEVEGPRDAKQCLINWYVAKVHLASHRDEVVCKAFQEVAQLLKPPPSLFAPQIVARVIRANLARRLSVQRTPSIAPAAGD